MHQYTFHSLGDTTVSTDPHVVMMTKPT